MSRCRYRFSLTQAWLMIKICPTLPISLCLTPSTKRKTPKVNDMSAKQDHPFHLVNPSPWPVLAAFSTQLMPVCGVLWMHGKGLGKYILFAGLAMVIFVAYGWWRDVVRERAHDHAHTDEVRHG